MRTWTKVMVPGLAVVAVVLLGAAGASSIDEMASARIGQPAPINADGQPPIRHLSCSASPRAHSQRLSVRRAAGRELRRELSGSDRPVGQRHQREPARRNRSEQLAARGGRLMWPASVSAQAGGKGERRGGLPWRRFPRRGEGDCRQGQTGSGEEPADLPSASAMIWTMWRESRLARSATWVRQENPSARMARSGASAILPRMPCSATATETS